MMRLYIEGRQVDLMQDEPLLITREIADIREPEKRSSDWSKTFRIPGTSNNNRVFGHIFDIAQEQLNTGTQFAPDFNPNKKAAALITVDEVEQVRGFVRLLNIAIVRGGEIEYEVSVHGVAADFFAKIRNKRLSEIDLSDLNHTLTKTAIKNSWNHNWQHGYVYPMIDRGRELNLADLWAVNEFYPALFIKRLIDEIFTASGYSYTLDSFFNTDLFKKLVIPSPGVTLLSESDATARELRARRSSNASYVAGAVVVFNDDSSSGYYDNGNNYDPGTGKYTVPADGKFGATLELNWEVTGINNTTYPNIMVVYSVRSDGRLVDFVTGIGENTPTGAEGQIQAYVSDIIASDTDEIYLQFEGVKVRDLTTNKFWLDYTSSFTHRVKTDSVFLLQAMQNSYGKDQLVNMDTMFANTETRQDELLQWIIRCFNLYIEPTDTPFQLLIKPRDEFYRDSVVHDLTALIDRSQPFDITPMGELEGNRYLFTYKEGPDSENQSYQQQTGTVYGEARILVDNDVLQSEKKIETGFIPTPFRLADVGRLRIASMPSNDNRNGGLRLLYWGGKVGGHEWLLVDAAYALDIKNAEVITGGIPYAGHLDNPFNPTLDLCFGMPYFINLPRGIVYTNNNLYNVYWRKYINEITDPNSKLVKVRVYITPANFLKWSFRDLYFFDGQYFRLNKIVDYPVGGSDMVVCEFLKLKTAPVFTPQTAQAGDGWDRYDDNNDRWPDLISREPGKGGKFNWATTGAGATTNSKPLIDWIAGVHQAASSDIGTPSTGDKFRPAIEWSGSDWNIVLIQEP